MNPSQNKIRKRKDRKAKNRVLKIMIVKNWMKKIQSQRLQNPKWKCTLKGDDDDDFNKLSKKAKGKLRNQIKSVMHQKRMRITVKELRACESTFFW